MQKDLTSKINYKLSQNSVTKVEFIVQQNGTEFGKFWINKKYRYTIIQITIFTTNCHKKT